jgi:hypothetical protein
MTRPEFFLLEAGEYLERIALLARKPEPGRTDFRRLARALQGTALMAGPPGYAVAAGAIDDIARRYEEGTIRWTPWLAGRIAAAIAQCQGLLRKVREWTATEIDLCRRIAEALQLEDPGEVIVPIESLAPDPHPVVSFRTGEPDDGPVVPIESLGYESEDIVPIATLLLEPEVDETIVPIEALLAEPLEAETPSRRDDLSPSLSPFEQSFSTFFRLVEGRAVDRETPVPIQRLVYRGRRALERVELLRRELAAERRERPASSAVEAILDELFDLVPLALESE